jgi:hypothetical protein
MAVAEPEVGYSKTWWSSMGALEGADSKRVAKAVSQFLDDPEHPGLNLHPIKGDASGQLHTFRASDDLRVLLTRQGNIYILHEVGHHDAIYELGERKRFVHSAHTGFIGLVDIARDGAAPAETQIEPATPSSPTAPGIIDHWGDADLREAGFTNDEIEVLRTCRTEDDLCDLDLEPETIELVIELLAVTPEQWRTPSLDPVADAEARIRKAITDHGGFCGISPLFTPEQAAALAAAPIEEWMIFLHPDQRAVCERRFEGPARVRGSAGTGKTVVALHRAAVLARRVRECGDERPILFTTFIKSLPPVFESLYGRMPRTGAGEVEFAHIDRVARAVCSAVGDNPPFVDRDKVTSAFSSACRKIIHPGSQLARARFTRSYLRQEITYVIKGRGLRNLAEYLAIERTGRRTRISEPLRAEVWALHEEWDRQMARRGTIDFPDVLLRALDHARRGAAVTYSGAIIDEAQDLTLVGLQLVRYLVNGGPGADVPDGLFIVGDGAQRIYPGGFTLGQAGVEVRGRTTVLRRNYRNTREIIGAAMTVAGREIVDDLGDEMARADAEADAERSGMNPVLVLASGFDDEMRFIGEEIRRLVDSGAIGHGDMAVSAATNDQVKRIAATLAPMGIPVQRLEDYDGTPTPRVKVGTHFRIKGLEFKVVFLPCLGAGEFPRKRAPGQDLAEYEEERSRSISQLYVAMTRARDGLFLLCSGDLSKVLDASADRFELLDT